MMCRGNSPRNGEVEDILAEVRVSAEKGITPRCGSPAPDGSRRTSFSNALRSGVKNIVSIQCNDGFCRMKEGTGIGTRRMLLEPGGDTAARLLRMER
jgi:hypothetical protein